MHRTPLVNHRTSLYLPPAPDTDLVPPDSHPNLSYRTMFICFMFKIGFEYCRKKLFQHFIGFLFRCLNVDTFVIGRDFLHKFSKYSYLWKWTNVHHLMATLNQRSPAKYVLLTARKVDNHIGRYLLRLNTSETSEFLSGVLPMAVSQRQLSQIFTVQGYEYWIDINKRSTQPEK